MEMFHATNTEQITDYKPGFDHNLNNWNGTQRD